jgi:short-subunit dehydrogenase
MIIVLLLLFTSICFNLNAAENTHDTVPKRAIIVGASAGMGRELAKRLAADGYIVGIAARRIGLLEELQQEIPTQTYIAYIDAAKPYEAIDTLNAMIKTMGGLDLLVLTITGYYDCDFENNDWTQSLPVLAVDVVGFFALARTGFNFFENQGYGHLVGFSSIDGLRGIAGAPAYSGSKAFCSRYLDAERNKYIQRNIPIFVTDMIPGWIDSKGDFDFEATPHAYWVETLEDATNDILEAIKNKTETAYITKRWQKVAELLTVIPNDLYNVLSARPGGGF